MADTSIIRTGERGLVFTTLDELTRFANGVITSKLAPKCFSTAAQVIVAMQWGAEVGLKPMQSLQSIAVINGRPALWGDAVVALAWASGKLLALDESSEGSGDALTAVCRVRRIGQEQHAERRFGVADAKRAGLWGKAGPWTQYPQRMLQMRARSWCFRDNFADVLCGLAVAEEARDIPTDVASVTQPKGLSIDQFDDETITVEPVPTESDDWPALIAGLATLEDANALMVRLDDLAGDGTISTAEYDQLVEAMNERAGGLPPA